MTHGEFQALVSAYRGVLLAAERAPAGTDKGVLRYKCGDARAAIVDAFEDAEVRATAAQARIAELTKALDRKNDVIEGWRSECAEHADARATAEKRVAELEASLQNVITACEKAESFCEREEARIEKARSRIQHATNGIGSMPVLISMVRVALAGVEPAKEQAVTHYLTVDYEFDGTLKYNGVVLSESIGVKDYEVVRFRTGNPTDDLIAALAHCKAHHMRVVVSSSVDNFNSDGGNIDWAHAELKDL